MTPPTLQQYHPLDVIGITTYCPELTVQEAIGQGAYHDG